VLPHPIPWDVSHGIPIGMTFPWTSQGISKVECHLGRFCLLVDAAVMFVVDVSASLFEKDIAPVAGWIKQATKFFHLTEDVKTEPRYEKTMIYCELLQKQRTTVKTRQHQLQNQTFDKNTLAYYTHRRYWKCRDRLVGKCLDPRATLFDSD